MKVKKAHKEGHWAEKDCDEGKRVCKRKCVKICKVVCERKRVQKKKWGHIEKYEGKEEKIADDCNEPEYGDKKEKYDKHSGKSGKY